MKTGLVLEGGAMRGIYTAGVLDVLMENGIEVDGVLGVSAGAIHGCTYVAGQQGRSLRYNKKYCRDWRYMSFRSLLFTGELVGRKFCYEKLPYTLDPFDFEAFEKSKTEFYACVTNVETGEPEYLKEKDSGRLMDCIRASASMPLVSRIVEIDGKKYLDGGTADSIPFEAFAKMGYDRIMVVTTRPEGYEKGPDKLTKLMKLKYKKYPEFIKRNENRHIEYNDSLKKLKELEQAGQVLVVRPSRKVDISRLERDLNVIQEQYDLGRADALEKLDEIKNYLSTN